MYLATVQALEREWLERIPGVEGLSCEGTSARFRSTTVRATVAGIMKQLEARGIDIAELRVSKATLEDVFLELTAESSQLSAISFQPERSEPSRPTAG